MDENLEHFKFELETSVRKDDMSEFWNKLSALVERAYMDCLGIGPDERAAYSGHRKVDFINKTRTCRQ